MIAAASTIFDKPAVAQPRQALSAAQREALKHAHRYRHHRNTFSGGWYLGPRYFHNRTIAALMQQGLLRRMKNPFKGKGYRLDLTMAGQIVLERLEKSDAR